MQRLGGDGIDSSHPQHYSTKTVLRVANTCGARVQTSSDLGILVLTDTLRIMCKLAS